LNAPPGPATSVPSGRQLVGDGFITFLCRVLSIVTALAMSIVTARFLGPIGRGIYVTPAVDAGIAASFFVGLSTATSYLLLNVRAGRGALRAIALAAVPFVAVCTVLVFALGWFGHHAWATIYAAASLPPTAIFLIAQGLCYGTKRVKMANYLGVSGSVFTPIGTIIGFLCVGRTPYVVITAWLVSQTLMAVFGLALIYRYGKQLPRDRVSNLATLGFAARLGGVSLVTLLGYNADVYLTALLAGPSVLGMYTIAVSGAQAVLSATQSVATTTAPHVGSLSDDDARRLTARAARNNVAIATSACVLIGLAAPLLVHVAFGTRFLPAVGALRILLVGMIAMSTSAVLSNYFTLRRGRPEFSLYVAGAGAATSISLSFALIPRLGIIGAALSVTTSYIVSALLFLAAFQRDSGLPPSEILLLKSADVRAYRQLAGRLAFGLRRRVGLAAEARS
jgi:O-antigen/teichoic acid export membrane protein